MDTRTSEPTEDRDGVGRRHERGMGRRQPHADVVAPLFVIGTGRSGTTALMDLIAYHGDLAWPSQYTARWGGRPSFARLSRIVNVPPFTSHLRFGPFVPKHAEDYAEWTRRFPGFAEPFRDLTAADVTPGVKERLRAVAADIVRHQRRSRFVTKYTGWSRIGFVREIFPDARFIHIVRDGRAVAYSWTTMPWWDGWGGPSRSRWPITDGAELDALARYGGSFLALAALQWKLLVDSVTSATVEVPSADVLELRYEDVVRDPVGTATRSIAFAGLDLHDAVFERHLAMAAGRIVDADELPGGPAWRRNVTAEQIAMIEDLCAEALARYGYL